jgi:hypothetical protein
MVPNKMDEAPGCQESGNQQEAKCLPERNNFQIEHLGHRDVPKILQQGNDKHCSDDQAHAPINDDIWVQIGQTKLSPALVAGLPLALRPSGKSHRRHPHCTANQ